jgi:hypothetical protein
LLLRLLLRLRLRLLLLLLLHRVCWSQLTKKDQRVNDDGEDVSSYYTAVTVDSITFKIPLNIPNQAKKQPHEKHVKAVHVRRLFPMIPNI